jgi:hypothetical protein
MANLIAQLISALIMAHLLRALFARQHFVLSVLLLVPLRIVSLGTVSRRIVSWHIAIGPARIARPEAHYAGALSLSEGSRRSRRIVQPL